MHRKKMLRVAGGTALVLAATTLALERINDHNAGRGRRAVDAAGYVRKTARVGTAVLNYVEGPDNGPPLVLLHAQHLDWFSYHRVLPALSRSFHVFAVDYPGHGKTTYPADYPMTAARIGADLGDFIATVVGQPAYVSGNSSGGLLTTWLAANRPGLVRAVLLEDPPLFSAEQPRIRQTIAYRSFVTSHRAVQEGVDDFLLYWIESNSAFFARNVGPGSAVALKLAVRFYRGVNPGAPVEIGLLPNDTVRQFVRGLDQFDARFGAAFYDGSWNEGFDHAAALQKITCPVLLLHAHTEVRADGTLHGAMSQQEADRAMSLLPHGRYVKTDATHVVHLADPRGFTAVLENFFLGESRPSRHA
jgi:pimeloyl-ACP methyl ester carboxylesterase